MCAHVFVTFTSAEFEDFGIVAHECETFGWIAWPRTEITCFDPHDC